MLVFSIQNVAIYFGCFVLTLVRSLKYQNTPRTRTTDKDNKLWRTTPAVVEMIVNFPISSTFQLFKIYIFNNIAKLHFF